MSAPAEEALRERDIRPDYLMAGQAKAAAADLDWLLRHSDDFCYVTCPACGFLRTSKAFEKSGMSFEICLDCGTLFINPRPSLALLKEYYARSEAYRYWDEHIFPASEKVRCEKIFRPRAERTADICRRSGIEDGTLLEVGAGFGTFCREMKRLGLFGRVIAVEPVPNLAQTCRCEGLEVIEEPIERVQLERDSIDVIASFEVIEHLFSPRGFLRQCRDILSPDGLLIVTCPNVKGFDIAVLEELSSAVGAEHLNYFHPASLSHLAERCGFEILEVLTPGKLDAELVRKAILAGELDVSSRPFLKRILVSEWEHLGDGFQRFLADNRLSSHMWLVARTRY